MTWTRRAFTSAAGGLPREFWWLWAGTLVNRAGGFVMIFLAVYLTQSLGYSATFAGLVLGAGGLGAMVAGVVGGDLADRLGRRPVLLWSQVGAAATLVALGTNNQPAMLLVLSGVFGAFSSASRPAFGAMIADIVAPPDRLRAFSLNYWAINLGFAVAAVLGGLLASSGYLLLFVLDAVTTLVFAVVIYLRVPESHPHMQRTPPFGPVTPAAASATTTATATAGSMLDVLRDRVFVTFMALVLVFALVFMQHVSTLPVQMADDGLSPAQFGSVLALNAILIVALTLPVTRVAARFLPALVMAFSGVFVGIGFGATAWASTLPAYVATVVIWTVGEVIGSALAPALVADLSPPAMRGRYQGAVTFTFSLAATVAPVLGGWVYDAFGGQTLWWGCGLLALAMSVGHLAAGPGQQRRIKQLRRWAADQPAPPAVV